MDGWSEQFDGYCERVDFTFWSEPLNAVTNAAFLIAAIWMWRRCKGLPEGRLLCAVLFAIGSAAFFSTPLPPPGPRRRMLSRSVFYPRLPFLVNRDFVGMHWGWLRLAKAGFAPYAAVFVPLMSALPFFRISNFYWTVPVLLFAYAVGLRRKMPETARGMVLGGALLCLSITIRSIDELVCHALPMGTHLGWHILNGVMLGWMIEVYRHQRTT